MVVALFLVVGDVGAVDLAGADALGLRALIRYGAKAGTAEVVDFEQVPQGLQINLVAL
jgi:hypothetical protein